MSHIDMGVPDTGKRPKVSVVLGVRNEYPQIIWTMLSFIEELEFWGYEWELVVVDNMSTDHTPDILHDKFRRWTRNGTLKVLEYDEKPANVTVRNIGAREATGDVVFLADGHLSIATGTCHSMIQGWLARGGLWHSAIQIFGDTRDIKCYGYDLKLVERFWGNLSRGVPEELQTKPSTNRKERDTTPTVPYYRVPMASHCCLMAGREEYLELGGYSELFKCYGGGEPYLDLLWWLTGREVWLLSHGLIRHAFGVVPRWEKAKKDRQIRNHVMMRRSDGDKPKFSSKLKAGDEYLRYSRGYSWTNDWYQYNFMLSAYLIGGYDWFQQRYEVYYEGRKGNSRYVDDLQDMRRDILRVGGKNRAFIAERQKLTLSELIGHDQANNPVEHIGSKPWCKFGDLV
jgi:glycosyltransferase involved in cell wall biosynthesis